MALYMNNTKVKSVYWNNVKAKKVYFNDVLVLSGGEFAFTYTGAYAVEGDLGGNFVIRFKTSGTLTITDAGNAASLDVFLVGGGGGGMVGTNSNKIGTGIAFGAGGGGGYTATHSSIMITTDTAYTIAVGAGGAGGTSSTDATAGGQTTAFEKTANGGGSGFKYTDPTNKVYKYPYGGNGGSGGGYGSKNPHTIGGDGGTDGGDGTGAYPGKGQGTTTKEFGVGKLYSSGGDGARLDVSLGTTAADNTGNGGGAGGSGIVCIRNHR